MQMRCHRSSLFSFLVDEHDTNQPSKSYYVVIPYLDESEQRKKGLYFVILFHLFHLIIRFIPFFLASSCAADRVQIRPIAHAGCTLLG